jgi:glutamyl-tRNA synthetase
VAGPSSAAVDDIVLRRNDGVPAYNLAVVVDDAAQGITEVVRGDDLLSSTPSQIHLGELLGLPTLRYAHVPLVMGPDGARLAKRHGAVTLEQLAELGRDADAVLGCLADSLGLARRGERVTAVELIDRFDIAQIPREPWCPMAT